MKWIIKVLDVKNYTVKTLWNDGQIRTIDLMDFLLQQSKKTESSYSQLLDTTVFNAVKCDGTTLYWDNLIEYTDYDGSIKKGSLDIAPEFLYELTSSYMVENA